MRKENLQHRTKNNVSDNLIDLVRENIMGKYHQRLVYPNNMSEGVNHVFKIEWSVVHLDDHHSTSIPQS